jgi:hypothetical protein
MIARQRHHDYLLADQFQFALPSQARIVGITVEIYKFTNYDYTDRTGADDVVVSLMKGGELVGANRATVDQLWANSSTTEYTVYGGTTDLWETSWTPAEIAAEGFGVAFSAARGNTAGYYSAFVRDMRVSVHYCE